MDDFQSHLSGLNLHLPLDSSLPEDQRHYLLYIPWDDKYLANIPPEFKKTFLACLPYLHVRTTDVHVAVCFKYLDQLILDYEKLTGKHISREIVGLSLILHDIGWSRLDEAEIAASLGFTGLKLSETALAPKEKHAVEGENIAREFLAQWGIDSHKSETIAQCVRWHDNLDHLKVNNNLAPEVQLVSDLDHLWSFTRENFWQDTARKHVSPAEYLDNLARDLDTYFSTESGRDLAKELLEQRKKEVTPTL